MDKVLIITNQADDARMNEFAHQFALQNDVSIIEARVGKARHTRSLILQAVTNRNSGSQKYMPDWINIGKQNSVNYNSGLDLTRVKTADASQFTERDLAAYIRKENCSMVISRLKNCPLNLQVVLSHISCPVMLLPEEMEVRQISRIVYLTDLRYCEPILSHLFKFKNSSVLLAHICQQGLPDLTPEYGKQLFCDTFGRYTDSSELFFSQIKETNVEDIVDTLINTMRADMLVCVHRRFHFQQLLGDNLPKRFPAHVTVPLLIFPC